MAHSSVSAARHRQPAMLRGTTPEEERMHRPNQQPTPTGPRRAVASYSSYQEAERAVDWLSDQGFAVERVSIVGPGFATSSRSRVG
jgi:Heat induced stress protein YflT domain